MKSFIDTHKFFKENKGSCFQICVIWMLGFWLNFKIFIYQIPHEIFCELMSTVNFQNDLAY